MTTIRALIFAACFAAGLPAHAESPASVLVVTEPEVPLQFEQEGEVRGIATGIVRELFQRADIEADIRLMPWARAYREAIQRPNVAIYSIAQTPQRQAQFHWIGPIVPYHWRVFRLQSRADIVLTRLDDLKRYKIGVVLGDAAHQFLLANGFSDLPAGNLSTAATANHLIRKLYAGRVDLMPMSELNCQFPVDQCSHFVEALKLSEMGNGLYLALRQDSEPALIKKLESAFQSMRQDGSLKSLQAPLQPASQ